MRGGHEDIEESRLFASVAEHLFDDRLIDERTLCVAIDARLLVGVTHAVEVVRLPMHAIDELRQNTAEVGEANRLGDVIVHPGGQALLAVAVHRVGRHRDDRRPRLGAFSVSDHCRCCISVHLRHLTIHEHRCILSAAGHLDRGAPVVSDVDRVPKLLQHTSYRELVDLVVLGDEHPARGGTGGMVGSP